jgi:hypothetical protein
VFESEKEGESVILLAPVTEYATLLALAMHVYFG